MKRVIFVSIIAAVIAIVAWAGRIVVDKLSAPHKIIALAERYHGWVDDNIPLTRIYVHETMASEDRRELLGMLPYIKGMAEIDLAFNSPDAKWMTTNLDLFAAKSLSIDGTFQLSDIQDLIKHSPQLHRLIIYTSSFPNDADSAKQLCANKGIDLSFKTTPMPATAE